MTKVCENKCTQKNTNKCTSKCTKKCKKTPYMVNGCYPVDQIQPFVRSAPISRDCSTFIVGMAVNLDPEAGFAFINGDCLEGYDVIISQIIAKKLGKKLVIVDIPFDELIQALQMGKVDMLASQMNQTSYRSDLIAQIVYAPATIAIFNLAILTTTYNLVKDSVVNDDWITALNNFAATLPTQTGISTNPGTVEEHYLLALTVAGSIPNLPIVLTESDQGGIQLVKSGYVLGYLVDSPVDPGDPTITNVPTAITIPSEIVGNYAIAVNIQCCCFIDKITKIIKELYVTGVLRKLANIYLKIPSDFVLDIQTPVCRDPTIRCRTCFNCTPINFGLELKKLEVELNNS